MSFDRGMDKEGVVHIDDGILLSHQKEKGKYNDATYMWNLKYNPNQLIYKTKIDSQV